ncbi:MAG TPA: TolC family protein [Candidatus Methylomirabilis sp.]|nr:TolC family protein [Candidatus Methylomirabilis sp.]
MRIFVLILLASFSPLVSAAQAGGPQSSPSRLTLSQALAMADAHYPRIRAALEEQIAARGDIAVARTAYLPRMDTLWQTNRATANNIYGLLLPQGVVPSISGPVLASDNTRSAWSSAGGALVSWQPFDFGLRRAQVNVARSGAEVASAGLNLTRLDVEVATANAYLDLAVAKQLAATAQGNVDRLQVFADTVRVLVDNQLRPGADAAQADAQLALARTQFIQARTNAEVRRAILADFLGIPASAIELDDTQLAESAPQDISSAAPITSHPATQQEAALVNQQRAQLSALTHSYAPQFTTQASLSGRGAGTSLNGMFPGGNNGLAPDTLNWAAGVQVTFPAFDIFSLRERKKVQEANIRAEQARYEQTVDDLSAQVQQAEAQLAGARQVAQNTPIELAAAKESEVQQRARFQSGLATVIDVATAESVLVQAEADDAVAHLNIWRSLAVVAAARGDLTPFLAELAKQP